MTFEDMEFGSYDKAERKALKAFELYEGGKISQALFELESALEINPSNSSWHFNKALALDSRSEFEDAICEYEIALQLNPDDLEILNSLAVDYTRIGQYDLAISTFEHIQQLNPVFEPCYCNRIITYAEMGQHELAEEMFYLAQQIKPDCALCFYNIGNSLFIRGQYKKAIHCWLKTAELEPSHPQINYRIAQAYWSDGSPELGREHFLAELRLNPGDVDVILDFGLFLLEAGDIESAKEKFNRILELKPDFATALFYLGEIAFDKADCERAVQLFNQALEKDNAMSGPRYRLAQCALLSGHKDEAKTYLVSEVELAGENADVLVSMGSMFLAIGELDLATHCLRKAVDIGNVTANTAKGFRDEVKVDKDCQCLAEACTNADAHYYLGLVNVARGQLGDAAQFLADALDIRPKDVRALRDSAIIYLTMDKLAEAAETIDKALGLAGNDSQLRALRRKVWLLQRTEQIVDFLDRFRRWFIHGKRSR